MDDTINILIEDDFQKEVDRIFNRIIKIAEEYKPESIKQQGTAPPPYVATPKDELKHIGPKKLTIPELKARTEAKKEAEERHQQKFKKTRGGKRQKLRKEKAEYYRLATIATGSQKNEFIKKAKEIAEQLRLLKQNVKHGQLQLDNQQQPRD